MRVLTVLLLSAPQLAAASWEKCAPPPGGWNILNLWSEAIFSIPENLKDQVNVTSEPSSLLAPVCQLEKMVPFGLLHLAHNFNLCEKHVLQLGLKTNLGSNEAGIVACTGGGFCHVRASPFSSPCVVLPDDLPEDDVMNNIGDKFEYSGIKPAMIGSIMGNALGDVSACFRRRERERERCILPPLRIALQRRETSDLDRPWLLDKPRSR